MCIFWEIFLLCSIYLQFRIYVQLLRNSPLKTMILSVILHWKWIGICQMGVMRVSPLHFCWFQSYLLTRLTVTWKIWPDFKLFYMTVAWAVVHMCYSGPHKALDHCLYCNKPWWDEADKPHQIFRYISLSYSSCITMPWSPLHPCPNVRCIWQHWISWPFSIESYSWR